MKSSRQPKRKISGVSQQHNQSNGDGVKKSMNRAKGQCQRAVEVKNTCGSPELSASKLLGGGISKRMEPDQQGGEINHSAKFKLQLFPLNENTRVGLEKDGYNPFLELTLSTRKKISSVIKHLNSKWGSSGIAKGELMLFPFNAQLENLASYSRWDQNVKGVTTGEVHVAVGSPAIFRLRYEWVTIGQFQSFAAVSSSPLGTCLESKGSVALPEKKFGEIGAAVTCKDTAKLIDINATVNNQLLSDAAANHMGDDAESEDGPIQNLVLWDDDLMNLSIGGLLSESSLQGKMVDSDRQSGINSGLHTSQSVSGRNFGSETLMQAKGSDRCMLKGTAGACLPVLFESEISIGGLLSEASLQGKNQNSGPTSSGQKEGLQTNMEKSNSKSEFQWDENLTTLSIGGLLSEASLQGKINHSTPKLSGNKSGPQEVSSMSDSFDAFILGRLNSNPLASKPLLNESHSSILDGEETCHAFAFGKLSSSSNDPSTSNRGSSSSTKPSKFPMIIENGESLPPREQVHQPEDITSSHPKGVYNEESSLGLSGIKWNDSLGPFDLGFPMARSILNSGESISISEIVR